MTPLGKRLCARIAATGPMTVAEYMAACLLDPEHGYYTTRRPFGREGDFITAPEISQMFGELVGLALAQAWLDRGAPAPFCLAEAGPGRGTLMADIWRATARVTGFHAAAKVVLIEASPALRAEQASRLADAAPVWCDSLDALPALPLFLVANEFLDALPIRQFQRGSAGWHERMLGCDGRTLTFGLSPEAPVAALTARFADTRPGDIVETNAPAGAAVATVAAHVAAHGGAALFIDYGDWRSLGDTLQAVHGHAAADPLIAPGRDDLTAHVAFEPLAAAARDAGACPSPMVPQGVFLERLGITDRARALASRLSGPALEQHIAAHRRLTHPQEMGTLFKTFGVTEDGSSPIPGLQTWP